MSQQAFWSPQVSWNLHRLLPLAHQPHFLFSLSLLLWVSVGCSGSAKGLARVAIQGEVTLNGEPLEKGVVKFIPVGETKGPVAVVQVEDGVYRCLSATGPVVGVHRVEIEADVDDNVSEMATNPKALLQHLKSQGTVVRKNPIPEKYNRQSVLTAEIASNGERTFDFEIETMSAEAAYH